MKKWAKSLRQIVQYGRHIDYHLLRSRFALSIERISRKIVLPGFEGLSLYDVSVFFIRGVTKGTLSIRASSFSYSFFLALFPAIIVMFTIIPYIPINHFQDTLMELMREFIPQKAYIAVEGTLFDIVKQHHGGLLSLGFILALYFSTSGIHSLIQSFNQTYHTIETRSWIRIRIVSLFLSLVLSFLLFLAITLITFGPMVLRYIDQRGWLGASSLFYILYFGKWLITIALLFFAFSFLYYFAPAKRRHFRFISAGSTLSTFLTILTSIGFNFYVNNFSKYNTLYGSIGTLMIVLVWIYFNAFIVLLGFELNASIFNAKKGKGKALYNFK